MAYFAKLGAGNIIVTVEAVSNDIATTEQAGIDFLNNLYNKEMFGNRLLIMETLEKTLQELVIHMIKLEMLLFQKTF